jgi:hypothetical protein
VPVAITPVGPWLRLRGGAGVVVDEVARPNRGRAISMAVSSVHSVLAGRKAKRHRAQR